MAKTLDIEDRADAHTTSRAAAIATPPARDGTHAPCLLDLHTCKYTGVTYGTDGSGDPVPRAPRPPSETVGHSTQASFFRLLIVRADTIGAEVASCSR